MLAIAHAQGFQPSDQQMSAAVQFGPRLAAIIIRNRSLVGFAAD